jgi:hypothetical protein
LGTIIKVIFWSFIVWYAYKFIRYAIEDSPKRRFKESETNLTKRKALGYDVEPDGRPWREVAEEKRVKDIRKSSGYRDDQ